MGFTYQFGDSKNQVSCTGRFLSVRIRRSGCGDLTTTVEHLEHQDVSEVLSTETQSGVHHNVSYTERLRDSNASGSQSKQQYKHGSHQTTCSSGECLSAKSSSAAVHGAGSESGLLQRDALSGKILFKNVSTTAQRHEGGGVVTQTTAHYNHMPSATASSSSLIQE